MWTDKDRAEQRSYLIFIGRNLHSRFTANLAEADSRFNKVSLEYSGDSTVTLYHNKRKLENEIAQTGLA